MCDIYIQYLNTKKEKQTIGAEDHVCHQEKQEVFEVQQSDAVVNPSTVMVKPCDAPAWQASCHPPQ